jgi:hypothetical protein
MSSSPSCDLFRLNDKNERRSGTVRQAHFELPSEKQNSMAESIAVATTVAHRQSKSHHQRGGSKHRRRVVVPRRLNILAREPYSYNPVTERPRSVRFPYHPVTGIFFRNIAPSNNEMGPTTVNNPMIAVDRQRMEVITLARVFLRNESDLTRGLEQHHGANQCCRILNTPSSSH